jgi:hypothetical protein
MQIMVSMELKCEIILCLCNADGAGTTYREQHRQAQRPQLSDLAPKVDILLLTNIILVHAKAALVHKVSATQELFSTISCISKAAL